MIFQCQPELVEGGFEKAHRLRQAQPELRINRTFIRWKEIKKLKLKFTFNIL